jgi:predicted O-methyltransferase YrrM
MKSTIPPLTSNTCPVELYQNKLEFEQLLDLLNSRNIKSVLEIGSMFGGTAWYWLNNLHITSLTIIDALVSAEDSRYAEQLRCHNVLWKEWCNAHNCELNVFTGYSTNQTIINNVKKLAKVDMLFIDGDHSFSGVSHDYFTFKEMVNPGGVIVFHDIAFEKESVWYGVKPLWDQLKNKFKYKEFIEIPGDRGLGVLYV